MSKQPGGQCCYEVTIAFKDMDMSGGDVDGPRWTGKWLDKKTTVNVVAPNEALAGEGARCNFYDLEKAVVEKVVFLCEVALVVVVS